MTLTGAPAGRMEPSAVWTGSQLLIWGGWRKETDAGNDDDWLDFEIQLPFGGTTTLPSSGGSIVQSIQGMRFRPSDNAWSFISTNNAPAPREVSSATWNGTEMFVWGGDRNVGGRYKPSNNSWTLTTPSPTGDTTERRDFATLWTGTEFVIWGGESPEGALLRSGLRYNPTTKTWKIMNPVGSPSARKWASAVWTGSEIIIWGGQTAAGVTNTGARYNPLTDAWTLLPTTNAPSSRRGHAAVWTGNQMLIWGGFSVDTGFPINAGSIYDPATGEWTNTSANGAPIRGGHGAVWTGTQMLIWGGRTPVETFIDTYSYTPRRTFYLYMKP